MGKDIQLQAHTLYDPIVFDGISAINAILHERNLGGCITGGISVQAYLPKEEHRKSVDLDFSILCGGGSSTHFRDLAEPLVDTLNKTGYSVQFRKKGFTYEFLLYKGEDSLLIQHHRRTISHFERQKNSLEREVENAHFHYKDGLKFPALSPEDIILHKISRSLIFSSKHNLRIPYSMKKSELRKDADSLREDVLARLANVSPSEVAKLRLYYDCLDIKSLTSSTGVNENYLKSASKDWNRGHMVSPDLACRTFYQLVDSI